MIDVRIPAGIKHHKEVVVSDSDSACVFGSGEVNVFATPALIALLERTALESIAPYMPEGYTTVGTEVSLKHLKATPIGMTVKGESYLRTVNGRKLHFELHAWDEKGFIAIGTHTRVIVEEKDFMEKLK